MERDYDDKGAQVPSKGAVTTQFQLTAALLEYGFRDPYVLIAFCQIIAGIQILSKCNEVFSSYKAASVYCLCVCVWVLEHSLGTDIIHMGLCYKICPFSVKSSYCSTLNLEWKHSIHLTHIFDQFIFGTKVIKLLGSKVK